MASNDDEEKRLRLLALQNTQAIVQARQRFEVELGQHPEWLRVMLASIGDAVIRTDAHGRISFMNGVAESLTGWTQTEALGHPLPDVFHIVNERTRQPVENPAARVLREGTVVGLANHTILIAKDGTERPIDDSAAPIRSETGELVGTVLVFRDNTDRHRAEEEIRESEHRFQLMADSAPVLIWIGGADKRRTWFNKSWLDFVGRPIEKEIGDGWADNVHADDAANCAATYLAAFADRRPFTMEYRLRRHDGEYRWLLDSGTPRYEMDRKFAGYIGSCVDITERKFAELVTGRLAAIVESSDDSIVGKGLDGVITSWNKGAEKMFGYTAAEAVGRHITFIIPAERRFEEDEVLSRLRRGERIDHFETVRQAKDGTRLDISLTVSPIKDSGGRVIGASKVARDITERKRAEAEREQLLASERSARAEAERAGRLKEEFLATLSHELRTPLTAIVGWIQILRTKPPTPEILEQGLTVIDRNVRVQAQLIADILDMSSIVSGKLRMDVQRVELPVAIERALESIRPAADAKNVSIQSQLEPILDPVYGDPTRLQQIVWNLVSNAVKFTPRGGRVRVVLARADSSVEIAVSDTGKGIKPEFLPHVFERFRQADSSTARQHGGLGLGLSIVKQLVELHGGTVGVASDGEGQGSTFTFSLPLAASRQTPLEDALARATAEPAATVRGDPPNLAGVRVLIVDDDLDARDLIKRVLEECHAQVVLAGSASEALAAAQRETLDVILSDIGMPEWDGYEFMRSIRSNGITVPAAALTAFVRSEDRARCLSVGYQMHIAKPVEPAALLAAVAKLSNKTVRNSRQDTR